VSREVVADYAAGRSPSVPAESLFQPKSDGAGRRFDRQTAERHLGEAPTIVFGRRHLIQDEDSDLDDLRLAKVPRRARIARPIPSRPINRT